MTNIIYDNYNLFLTDLKNIDVLIHNKTNVNHISIAKYPIRMKSERQLDLKEEVKRIAFRLFGKGGFDQTDVYVRIRYFDIWNKPTTKP